jgi:ribosomal protein S27AE
MLKLKSCPKCKEGDVTSDRDQYGRYEYCIQCGYTRDLMHRPTPKTKTIERSGVQQRRSSQRWLTGSIYFNAAPLKISLRKGVVRTCLSVRRLPS